MDAREALRRRTADRPAALGRERAAAPLSRRWIRELQRSAGNRAVGRLLAAAGYPGARRRALARDKDTTPAAAGIKVNKGSKLSAGAFANALKGNKKVPGWLKHGIAGKGDSLVLGDELKPPEGKLWPFVEPLQEAFKSGRWELTTARSTIHVKSGDEGKLSWSQIVMPDMAGKEQVGVGTGTALMPPYSNEAEVITGWTLPGESSDKRGSVDLILVVTEIEVVAPNGKRKTFKPGPDDFAEALLHEISVHAGRISQGLPDTHDDADAVVRDLADSVGELFRADPHGDLKPSPLRDEIRKFLDRNGAATPAAH